MNCILIFMSHWKKKIPVHVSYNLTDWETCCWYTHRHTHFPMRLFPGGPTWFQTYRQTDRHCHPIYQNKTYHYNRNSSSWDHHDRKTSIHLLKAIKTCTCYNNILIVLTRELYRSTWWCCRLHVITWQESIPPWS